tara:strand:- start:483 stop:620 length:138 start_codon:yes stop_codon:yes gene_type:complete
MKVEFAKKTVSIRKDQDEWLKRHSISLSRLTQKLLDKEIKRRGDR